MLFRSDVTQTISEHLEPGALVGDGHVALVDAVELLLQIERMLEAVVEEEVADRRPDGERAVGGAEHDVQDNRDMLTNVNQLDSSGGERSRGREEGIGEVRGRRQVG